jgi:hypothetical protein
LDEGMGFGQEHDAGKMVGGSHAAIDGGHLLTEYARRALLKATRNGTLIQDVMRMKTDFTEIF